MSKATNPPARAIFQWLRANLGKNSLAPLTGTDARALSAAVQIIELYAYNPTDGLIESFEHVVRCMQPKCRYFAYHSIAHILDWHDRAKIWSATSLGPLDLNGPVPKCAFEPK